MHGFLQDVCSYKSTLVALTLLAGSVAQAELKYRFVSYPELQSGGILDGTISLPDDFLGRDPMSTPIANPFSSGFEWSAISSAGESISVPRNAPFKSVGVTYGSVSVTESAIVLSLPPAFDTGSFFFEEIVYTDGFRVETRMLLYTLSKNPSLNRFRAFELITHSNGSETLTVLWSTVPSASFIASSGWVIATRVPEPAAIILLLTIAMASSLPQRASIR